MCFTHMYEPTCVLTHENTVTKLEVVGCWLQLSYEAIGAPHRGNMVCPSLPQGSTHLYILCQQEKSSIGQLHLIKQAAMCAERDPLRVCNLI